MQPHDHRLVRPRGVSFVHGDVDHQASELTGHHEVVQHGTPRGCQASRALRGHNDRIQALHPARVTQHLR
eukprot:4098385-Prorocentrum_lima.AAC.1